MKLKITNKIHFTSLGCSRNLVDTEVMIGIVLHAGYEITGEMQQADFLVVNTCGFLESARRESCETIEEMLQTKKEGAKVIVAGCMVQKYGDKIRSMFPGVHYFLGSGDMEKILAALQADIPAEEISAAKSYLQWGEIPRFVSTPRHYAYLKIAEGCAKRCSFCIIPTIKGPLKSKSIEQVVKEFRALLDNGVFEVILIAQDLGDFGKERRQKDGLEILLKELLKIDRKFWLRLLYLYPDEITPGLVELMKNDSRICRYLDMPIQHISDPILKSMRRKTNKEQIIQTITTLRKELPDVVIRTSLMVGYPGESNEQFQELMEFIQKHPLDNIGVFKFSLEEGAHAATLPNQIADEVKQERYELLMNAQKKIAKRRQKKYIGKTLEVLIDGYHPETRHLLTGRFFGQCPEIDGQVIINDFSAIKELGKLALVEVTDAHDYDLVARAIEPVQTKSPRQKLSLING